MVKNLKLKGTPATLGEKPFNLVSTFNEKLGKYGIDVKGGNGGIIFNNKKIWNEPIRSGFS